MRKITFLFIALSFIFPAFAFAQTINSSALQAQLQALEQELSQLQNQANGTTAQAGSSSATPTFTHSLTVGSQGADVSALQQILINGGYLTAITAPSGYFGQATKKALVAYQNAKSITPATGYCGPITIRFLNNASSPTVSAASGNTSVPVAGNVAPTLTAKSQPETITTPSSGQQAPAQQPMASTTLCNGTTYTTTCPAGENFVCPAFGDAMCASSAPAAPIGANNPYSDTTPACIAYQAKVSSTVQQVIADLTANGGFSTPSQILSLVLARVGNPPSPFCEAPILINGQEY